jgi:hypothetical protein
MPKKVIRGADVGKTVDGDFFREVAERIDAGADIAVYIVIADNYGNFKGTGIQSPHSTPEALTSLYRCCKAFAEDYEAKGEGMFLDPAEAGGLRETVKPPFGLDLGKKS